MTSPSKALPAESLQTLPPNGRQFFSSRELEGIQTAKIPEHVAIIMDGNRRWAKQKSLPPVMGHWEGAETLYDIVKAAAQMGIKTLTVYSFSTENRSRASNEVESLMEIFEFYLHQKRASMIAEGVHLDAIGDLSGLPEKVQQAFQLTKSATSECHTINLVLALNYGGRDELKRAMSKLLDLYDNKELKKEDLTE
jgi:undecaprenyl diphosphate synthase